MIVTFDNRTIYVQRETGEARADAESHFWHKLRTHLITSRKEDWKRVKPCNKALTSMPYALQLGPTRKRNKWIVDYSYDVRPIHTAFNKRETVELQLFDAERDS
jgi:hypothetical protein